MGGNSYILADPFSVATHGVLDENIGIGVVGWIVNIPLSSTITIPTEPLFVDSLREWWVRKFFFVPPVGEFELEGPFNFTIGAQRARDISKENESGLTELVTYEDSKLFVVSTYLRGKQRYTGKRAYEAAQYNLPPTL